MKQFQHCQFYAWGDISGYDLTDLLDTFGAEGWELVNLHVFQRVLFGEPASYTMLIFKREYEGEKAEPPFNHFNTYINRRKAEFGSDWECPKVTK